jgi:L-Ala-D/L-Glu epimerase
VTLKVSLEARSWPMREPFAISRGVQTEQHTLCATLEDAAGNRGRGEGCGVPYAGETPESMMDQIASVRTAIERGVTREALLHLLPRGGARCALDAALWDLEAKASGIAAFTTAGICEPKAVHSAYTIGIRPVDSYRAAAAERAHYAVLKIKVAADDPVAAVEAARAGAPDSAFIVDPNQAWSVDTMQALAPSLSKLGVVLLEQPIKVGEEELLDGYRCPIRLCADELIHDVTDLAKARGRFDVINIKLDKTGGLTEALRVADAALACGFDLMAGCMAGSSLSMAPAMILAQRCSFVDLDGPLLQADDWPDGLAYHNGLVEPPARSFWG